MTLEQLLESVGILNISGSGAGEGDVLQHVLLLNADRYLPVDEELIPLGDPRPVEGTPMDFTRPKTIGSRIGEVPGGYDHCYVLNKQEEQQLSLAARLTEPKKTRTPSERTMYCKFKVRPHLKM